MSTVLYDMVRYFRIGDDVVTSADLQRVDVIELIDFMADYLSWDK